MTISAYTGLPGHGKSYGVVENVIVPALREKREVFTNVPMNNDECLERFGMIPSRFDTQDVIDNPDWWSDVFKPGALIVIDELWRLWPSGLKANNVRQSDKSFLAEHRHLVGESGTSTEIVFVTQDLSQIASFARSLVETTYRVTKLTKMGSSKRFRVDVYFGPVTGANPPTSRRDREIYGQFKSEITALYISHTKSTTGNAGNETRVDKRFNVFAGYGVKIGGLVLIILCIVVWKGSENLLKHFGSAEENPDVDPPVSLAKLSSEPSLSPAKLYPEYPVSPAKVSPSLSEKPAKPKIFNFLATAENIFITYNNGQFPNIDYRYLVVFEYSEVTLNYEEMQRLGYELEPVNQCMVKIKGPDYQGFALCETNREKSGWVESMVASTGSFSP